MARIRTYGSVPTAMRGLVFRGGNESSLADLPDPGHDLLMDGKKIGSWGTGAWSVTRDRVIALAFLDRDHRAPGTLLKVETGAGTTKAEVVILPFFRAADQGEKARHLHDRAVHMFSGGDDDGAVAHLEEALRLDPGLQDAYEALGVILGGYCCGEQEHLKAVFRKDCLAVLPRLILNHPVRTYLAILPGDG